VPATRWAKARPGVRVDEHLDLALPTGYLRVAHLTDKAAAWCTLDGRFGRVDWSTRQVHAWHAKVDGMVQTLCAAADALAIGTAVQVQCFDAGRGKRLWHSSLGKGRRLLDATRDVMVVADGKSVIASSPKKGELWSVRTSGGSVAARVSGDSLVLAEPGRVRVLALASGEEQWHAKASGKVILAGGRLLVPEGSHTSLVYSLHDSVAKKLKTSVALARPSAAGVRVADGTLVPIVTGTGAVVLVDLPDAVDADRAAVAARGRVAAAWLAGPFLVTTAPLSVAHVWGGIATSIPLAMDPATGALVAGPAQVLIRGTDRSTWLEFS
jgi:outer membrane protein assembly factor BamB